MQRRWIPTIGRTLRLALIGIALTLAVIAALGIGSLFDARQDYEDKLERTYQLEAAGARLAASGAIEMATFGRQGEAGREVRERAAMDFAADARAALALADGDSRSEELVRRRIRAQRNARRAARPDSQEDRDELAASLLAGRALNAELAARQTVRRADARDEASSDTRQAILISALAGALALAASAALVVALLNAIRTPLEDLVEATAALAAGDLSRRVHPAGPRELRGLGDAFNTMAGELDHAQRQVEQERRRLEVTVASLGDALLVADADGRVDAVNPRARELIPELSPGSNVAAPESPLPPLERALGGEAVVEDGGRALAVTAARLEEGAGVVWTVRDTSERARLERLKTEFVATASHELRSPLTSIKGFVELLAASRGLTRKQREFVEVIELSTERLVDLVNDLLDVARIEAGRMEIHPRACDLAPVVEEVAALMKPPLDDRGQRLDLDLPAGTPPARADPARMRQVLTNLIANANLHAGEGARIEVSLGADGDDIALRVADNGRGMPSEELGRIFDRFYRTPGREEKASGSGLGLAIVKSLMDLHEGSISVRSGPGEGTEFDLRLPRAVTPSEGADAAREELGGKRILVVEDEPEIAALISEQLRSFGAEVESVGSGEEAIERLEQESFDALTLDIMLPGMSGFDVLEALRGDGRAAALPVVVVSVLSAEAALAGEWTVAKPIQPLDLADALGAAVTAGRSRVLVVGRESVRSALTPWLDRANLEHEWVTSASVAARRCREERFEAALVDAGMNRPQAALEALELRGRRPGRAVVLFHAGDPAGSPSVAELGADPVAIEDAAVAVVDALRRDRHA